MTSKRQFILYAIAAIALLALAAVFLMVRKDQLSDTPVVTLSATTSVPLVRTSSGTARQAPEPPKTPFRFEVAATQAAQMKGLGGRADVPSDYGMLFVFSDDADHGFWMKDMLVPIDIVWVSEAGVVAGIEDSVPPSSYPHVFYPPEPVRYVLETRAGEMRRLGITAGTKLNLPLPYGQTVSE